MLSKHYLTLYSQKPMKLSAKIPFKRRFFVILILEIARKVNNRNYCP